MPLPGPSEAAVVAKVGTAVARGLKQANPPIQWPNARESLLELFSLLVAWCEDAADTKEYAYQKLSHGESVLKPPSQTANRKWFGFGYTGYIETTRSDINRIVDGHAPLLKRWRASGHAASGEALAEDDPPGLQPGSIGPVRVGRGSASGLGQEESQDLR